MITLKPGTIKGETIREILESVEVRVLREVIKAMGGDISLSAKRLGKSRKNVYRLMRKHGIPAGFGRS